MGCSFGHHHDNRNVPDPDPSAPGQTLIGRAQAGLLVDNRCLPGPFAGANTLAKKRTGIPREHYGQGSLIARACFQRKVRNLPKGQNITFTVPQVLYQVPRQNKA